MEPDSFGRYVVRRRLGSGAFATVWLCSDPDLNALVAVKVLSDNYADDEDIQARFIQEARILRQLDDERILRVHTIDSLPDGRPYFVADYADGGTLERFIAERAGSSTGPGGGPFTLEEAIVLSRDLAMCLAVAHSRKIVHRDLKPSNVLFKTPSIYRNEDASDGTGVPTMEDLVRGRSRVVLADFGIARALESATGHTISAGTPHYMAPEQADASADERTDLYAAAVIMYELLAGSKPYPYPSVMEVVRRQLTAGPPSITAARSDLPPSVDEVLRKGMAVEPSQRFQTASEWMRALDDIASETVGPSGEETEVGNSHETIISDESTSSQSMDEGPISGSGQPDEGGSSGDPGGGDDASHRKTAMLLGGGAVVVALILGLFLLLRPSPPPVPAGVEAVATLDGFRVSWSRPAGDDVDIAEYRIARDGMLIAGVPDTSTEFLDTDASLADNHEYQVQSRDGDGRTSDFSDVITAGPIAAPAPPSDVVAVVREGSVELSWEPSADRSANLVSGYGIYRDGERIGSTDSDQTSYTDGDVDVSVAHEYAVDAAALEEIRSNLSASVTTEPFVIDLLPEERIVANLRATGADVYTFSAEEGDFVTIFVESEDETVSSYVEVTDESGRVVASDEDDFIVLDLEISSTGRYFTAVRSVDGAQSSYEIFYRQVSEIQVGTAVREALDADFVEWSFEAARGDLIAVTFWPDDAVGSLVLLGQGVNLEATATAEGEPIVLTVEIPADGRYFAGLSYVDGGGSYDMSVLELAEFLPQRFGSGTLSTGETQSWTFTGRIGSELFLFVEPDDADVETSLELFGPAGASLGQSTDAIFHQVQFNGTYEADVTYTAGSGDYTLRIFSDLDEGIAAQTVNQSIESANASERYTFRAVAGELVLIQMTSESADPVLALSGPGAGGDLIDENDDSFGTLNATVATIIPEDGLYFIDAEMFEDVTGPYTLTLVRFGG